METDQSASKLHVLIATATSVQLTPPKVATTAFNTTSSSPITLAPSATPPSHPAAFAFQVKAVSPAQPASQDYILPTRPPARPVPQGRPTARTAIREEQVPYGAMIVLAPTIYQITQQELVLCAVMA